MEFERQQFAIYRIVLKRFRVVLWGLLLLSSSILLVSSSLRLWYYATPQTNYLSRCLDTYFQRYRSDKEKTHLLMQPHQLLRFQIVTDQLDPLYKQPDCSIKQDELHNNSVSTLRFFEELSLEYFQQTTLRSHKVQQIYIALAMSKITHPWIYNYFGTESVLVDKLRKQFLKHQINSSTLADFSSNDTIIHISTHKNPFFVSLVLKIGNICLAYYRFLVASILCGILVISLNIFLNALWIPIQEICKRRELPYIASGEAAENPLNPSRVMFIEEHLHSFRVSPNYKHLKLAKYIILGFIGMSFVMVIEIEGFVNFTAMYIIGAPYNRVNVITMLMICVLEQLSLLLFRTRTSIKYGPSIIVLIYCICLHMTIVDGLTLPQFYLYNAFWLSLAIIMYLALFVEIPVMSCSENATYKPTIDRPRTFYFPNFNLGWHTSPAPLWSYFVPQHPREFFNEAELSYVDRNYDLLYSQLLGLPTNVDPAVGPVPHLQPEEFMMI